MMFLLKWRMKKMKTEEKAKNKFKIYAIQKKVDMSELLEKMIEVELKK